MQEVDDEVAIDGAADTWLEQWQIFRSHVGPQDEVWEYSPWSRTSRERATARTRPIGSTGMHLLRDGEIVESIPSSPWS